MIAIKAHEPGHLYSKDLAQALAHISGNRIRLGEAAQLDREVGQGRRCLDVISIPQMGIKYRSLEPPGATHLHRGYLLALRKQVKGSGRHSEVARRLVDANPWAG